LAGYIVVYPLYHQGVSYGDYENTVPFGNTGVEGSYVPVADVGFYHGVPGHMDG
jgi:hypothetical protein